MPPPELLGTQEDLIVRALKFELPNISNIPAYIEAFVDEEQRERIYQIPLTRSPEHDAILVVATLKRIRTEASDPIPPLVAELAKTQHFVSGVLDMQQRPALAPGTDASPFTAQLVGADRLPFFDRDVTRTVLESLLFAEHGPRVMVMRGPSKSGKSYTNELIGHVADNRGDFATAGIDFAGDRLRPEALAERIVRAMKRPVVGLPAAGHEQRHRTAEFIAKWILDHVVASDQRWCLVIDGLSGDPAAEDPAAREVLLPETENLILHLVGAAEGIHADRLRLVLIGYSRTVARSGPHRNVKYHDIPPPSNIAAVELHNFFTWCCDDAGLEKTEQRQQLIDNAIDEILDQVGLNDRDRLERIAAAATEVRDQVLAS